MSVRRAAIRAAIVAVLVATAGFVFIPAIEAQVRAVQTMPLAFSPLCGTEIVADLTLTGDVMCGGSALVIGANDVEIELNGYRIIGPGANTFPSGGNGIAVSGVSGVEIEGPGKIMNFQRGIFIRMSHNVEVEDLRVEGNAFGIDVMGSQNIEIEENHIEGNMVGIRVSGSQNIEIEENRIRGNGDGIVFQTSTASWIVGNKIDGNSNGLSLSGNGGVTQIIGNKITKNTCGVKRVGFFVVGYTFIANKMKDNGQDFC